MLPHFKTLTTEKTADLNALVARARELKAGSEMTALRGKVMALMFFNPSLRTRTSFETLMFRYGGHGIVLSPGHDTWKFESQKGVVMNGACAEHLQEAVQVLSRYVDCIGVRSFAGLQSLAEDAQESVLEAFAKYATVPVVNMESAFEHPCQGTADFQTLTELYGDLKGKRFVLSWAPHIKPLPLAVPHSALLTAAHAGMNITVAAPKEYQLAEQIVSVASALCQQNGGNLEFSTEQTKVTKNSDVVYVKSWGAPCWYGDLKTQQSDFNRRRDWCITPHHLGPQTKVMHCLPVRRNVVIADEVLDGSQSVVVQQAENRLWSQAAIMERLFSTRG